MALLISSPSVRGRGLKQLAEELEENLNAVALRAGAWIETKTGNADYTSGMGRPPCGGVD